MSADDLPTPAEAARRRSTCDCGRSKASYESRCVYCREPMVGDD